MNNKPERFYEWILWRMSKEKYKEANRIYYAIKGQLIPEGWSDKDINRMVENYTQRLWYNHERMVYTEDKFEKLWAVTNE